MQKYIDKTKSLVHNELFFKKIPKTPEAVFSKDISEDKNQHEDDKKDHEVVEVKYMDELKENDKGLVCIGKTDSELRKDKFYDDYYKTHDGIRKLRDPIEKTINYKRIIKTVEKNYEIESDESLRNRIYKIINFIKKTNKKKILIVSHGSYISYFLQFLFRVNRVKYTFNGVENCHISLLGYVNDKFNLLYGPSTEHFNLYDKK